MRNSDSGGWDDNAGGSDHEEQYGWSSRRSGDRNGGWDGDDSGGQGHREHSKKHNGKPREWQERCKLPGPVERVARRDAQLTPLTIQQLLVICY